MNFKISLIHNNQISLKALQHQQPTYIRTPEESYHRRGCEPMDLSTKGEEASFSTTLKKPAKSLQNAYKKPLHKPIRVVQPNIEGAMFGVIQSI